MNTENIKKIAFKSWSIPKKDKVDKVLGTFGLGEKIIFYFLSLVLILSSLSMLYEVNKNYSTQVPANGGVLKEGIIGTPRFINPILALSDADRDLSSIIYSGLLKATPDGRLAPDLAESYTISEDGTIYTFILKPNITFHDGTKITTDDIEFTVLKAQDSALKSPKRSSWDQVKVEKIDDKTIRFILKQPYSPFIENTTLGIIPKHIWKNVDNESFLFSNFNIKAIGSGPYMIDSIQTNDAGLPTEYTLKPFKKYALGKPFIKNIILKFYSNEKDLTEAYEKNQIDSINSISPEKIWEIKRNDGEIIKSPLPRIFGLFFNQNSNPVLANPDVRKALNMATPKDQIVRDVFYGYASKLDYPIPWKETSDELNLEEAKKILEKSGFKMNESGIYEKKDKKENLILKFSISTSDTPELKAVAQILQESYRKIGADVEIKIFEIGDLNQNIIRPRKYDSLLFGEIVGRDLDLYPFWHSSQRNDPGLNISMYTNLRADKILEDLRKIQDKDQKEETLKTFLEEIKKDDPAVFIYSPDFIYIVPKEIQNIQIGQINNSGERFANINEWFIETNNVWKIFNR